MMLLPNDDFSRYGTTGSHPCDVHNIAEYVIDYKFGTAVLYDYHALNVQWLYVPMYNVV
jgi:hypothetical protein